MKKGLLSILALAVTIVGCQNYDDQFDALNTQITALKSQVDGLAAVQSAVTALQGQLSSLSSAALTSADLDAALTSGLADIIADVEAVQAAVADVASAADVSAVNDALTDAQADLDELLANSAVFSGDVVVNSSATLDAFHSIGSGLNIVNGNVTIDVSVDMDQPKVQELVDNILTVTKDFTYTAAASTIDETTFNNLSGVQTLTLKQGGGYQASTLASASKVVLNDAWKSTVTMIDLRSLTSGTLVTGSTNHTVAFNKATEIHLTALPRYGSALTLEGAEGGVIDITALRDVGADGDQSALALSITGPAAVTISELDGEGGSITASKIGTLTVNSYDGTINVGADVTTFNSDNVVDLGTSSFADTETVNITGVVDPNHTGSTADQGPAFSFTTNTDMETVTLAGTFASVNLQNQASLSSLTVSADVTGSINASSNSDLESVTLTGSKATGVTVSSNDDLATLTVDTTMRGTAAAATTINGSVVVKSNQDLESLVVTSNKLRTVDIQDNDKLESINFTGVNATGSTAKASVKIYDNNLQASVAQDKENTTGCTSCGDGEANDKGQYTSDSGMSTLKGYLDAVIADTGSTAAVYFDVIDSITDKDGDEDFSAQTYETNPTRTRVLQLAAAVGGAAAKGEIAAQRAFLLPTSGTVQLHKGSNLLFAGSSASAAASLTAIANKDLLIAEIKKQANIDRFAAYDITLNAKRGGDSSGTVSLVQYASGGSTATILGQRYTSTTANAAAVSTTNYGVGVDDVFTLTVGTNSVSVSPGTGGATTLSGIADDIVAAWATKYGSAGTASASAIATVTNSSGVLNIEMLADDSAGYNVNVDFGVSAGTVTATNANNIDYVIGSTRSESDDATDDRSVIVTIKSTLAGTLLNAISSVTTSSSGTVTELTSTKTVNTADTTAAYTEAQEARTDVVNAEDGVAAVAPTTAAISFTRVHWLGS